ncbi:uncharacterized protein KZ484_012068 [Pholidichthys leucotaenia]
MFSGGRLRELVRERLAAAAEEIITEFELITNQYEEEIDRQRRLLNMRWYSQIKIHRIDFSQQPECKAEEVVTEQQLWNQERNSVLDQEEPEAPQVKEEQEELCISQEGEQLVVKLEADPFMGTLVCEEKQQSEAEPSSEQLLSHNSAGTEIQDEEGSQHVDSGSTKEEEPKPKKRRLKTRSHSNSDDDSVTSETLCENETDAPQLYDCKEEEVLTVQQLCNQERNSSLDQEEQDAAQVKEEEEELCSNQEEEDFGLKQETDTFMVTPADEDNDKSETEANSEQLLSHNSADTESQDQGAGKNVKPGSSQHEEPKKRLDRNTSDRNNVDNSSMSENQCDTVTGDKSVKCSDNDKDCKNESQKKKHYTVKSHVCTTCGKRFGNKSDILRHERIHSGEKPFSCEMCGQSFNRLDHLKTHMRIHTGEKPFSCKTCGQSFNQLDKNESQKEKRHTVKSHVCNTCGKRFWNKGDILRHERIHTGEKPFSCEMCGQRFNLCGTLKRHMRIHTGEKPFSCETCGQRFNQRGTLKTHMRIHTGEV